MTLKDNLTYAFKTNKRQFRNTFVSLFLLFIIFCVDLVDDYFEGLNNLHMGLEVLLMIFLFYNAYIVFRRAMRLRVQYESLQARTLELEQHATRLESEKTQHSEKLSVFLLGLGQEIDNQFQIWNLTLSEKEIGLLLLKGFSYREIGEIRKTRETTVRQQAMAIYHKGGMTTRAAFAGYFLEDLLLPSLSEKSKSIPLIRQSFDY